jgi:signal transduction histidine kinase
MAGILRLRESSRREAAITLACTAALALLIAGFVALEIAYSYRNAMDSGRTRGASLALLLEEQTRRTVQAIDFSLVSIANSLRQAPDTPRHDPALTARMRARLAELPYVRALFVIGTDGFLIQDTDSDTPNVSLADRDYFQVHLDGGDAGLYIGQPIQSRKQGAPWFLSMSRPITRDDGTLYGIAVAAVEPKYFARLYGDIGVGKEGALALIHRSGTVIARYPEHERGVGFSLAANGLFTDHLPAAGSGTFEEKSLLDGVVRLYAYRELAPLPLIVAVGISKETLLADWAHKVRISIAAALAVVLTLVVGAALLVRRRASELLAAERLQQIEKAEALGQMTSSVAHDFNNLLAVIGGNLELVARRTPQDDPTSEKLSRAMDAVGRGARLVSQLLAFARHKPQIATRENPAELIGGMSELLRQGAQPCDLAISPSAGLWSCTVDTGQFERSILNLVVNARDASPPGGRIELSYDNVPRRDLDPVLWPDLAPGDYVACRVRDYGAGMPPDVVHRAYEPFFTTKAGGRGTGLGLSQVFGFVRQSGGGIHIDSKVGEGTTVTLLLPRAAEEPAVVRDHPSPALHQHAAPDLQPRDQAAAARHARNRFR